MCSRGVAIFLEENDDVEFQESDHSTAYSIAKICEVAIYISSQDVQLHK